MKQPDKHMLAGHHTAAGNLLTMRCVELELYGSASKRVSKLAGVPFMKLNGKFRLGLLKNIETE